MIFRVAIAVIALAVPASAQHGGARAGSFGGRGFSGSAGFSSHPAFSGSSNFARPAQPARYGSQYRPMPGAGFRTIGPRSFSGLRNYATLRTPYNGNRFVAARPAYNPRAAGLARGADRDRFNARRRQFQSWFVNTYPYWPGYGYPYLLDPNFYNLGLYDWGDSDNSAADGGTTDQAYDPNGPAPLYPAPYPDQRPSYSNAAPSEQLAASAAPSEPEQLLTVIFKNGRAPIEVKNYMMTAKVLTDLDSEHYEQIPLDQIDLAATKRFNTFAGVDFQIPGA
jgi:hypothetical protein